MPIYEYFCPACQKKSSFLLRSGSAPLQPKCNYCGNTNLTRTISTFAYHRSPGNAQQQSGEPDHPGRDYYKDPRNIGRWVEKKFQDMGMELPDQLKQKIEAAREGILPEPLKDFQSASPDAAYH
jgi:putative FmdB family regulatory protein